MDDTCIVCAETLEWVAYGQCGHREVCSICISRLRFICDDHRCCLCKSETSIIFVTKAFGDYTRMINDFSVFPVDPTEGQVGQYWYHKGTQAFFDDLDHYKMIKAMGRLSCIVCDNMDEQGKESSKRKVKFRNIEQLKSHLFHCHKLFMCNLCLEGRKIFICEQKLYTRAQLNQHINSGDSEVDGSESERGGFMGHPKCEFCHNPFYGDNELYSHMSTEHYTCHICQRQNPGKYEYYKNYDELEVHFHQDHFLCEDEGCLAKKFIVFATKFEMKRHNVMEHGGCLSRSKRNATLQIPTNFQYERSTEHDLSRATSSSAQADSEPSSRHCIALRQNPQNAPLEESSFPPLPMSTRNSQEQSRNGSGVRWNTMAANLRRRKTVTVLHSSWALPATDHQMPSSRSPSQLRPASNSVHVPSSGSAIASVQKPATLNGLVTPNSSSSAQSSTPIVHGLLSASSSGSSRNRGDTKKINHFASALNLVDRGSLNPSTSNSPHVSAAQTNNSSTSGQPLPIVEDFRTANKSLVERIRYDLEFDKEKIAAFKEISSEYRRGIIDTGEYLAYVCQFGLSHLVLELARLCPDAQKQKELLEAYNTSLGSNISHENSSRKSSSSLKHKKGSKKGKEKCEDDEISGYKAALAGSIISSVRELQSSYKPTEGKVEELSKGGYNSGKGKSKAFIVCEHADFLSSAGRQPAEPMSPNDSQSAVGGTKSMGRGNKQRKKTSKFLRVRLRDSSLTALLDLTNSDSAPNLIGEKSNEKNDPSEGLAVCGVWQNGGGQRLVANLR